MQLFNCLGNLLFNIQTFSKGGIHGVKDIVIGNGYGSTNSNLGQDFFVFHRALIP